MSARSNTENFFTRNVRLVTFITVIVLFLIGALILAWMVHGELLFPFSETADDRPAMTVEELRDVCSRARTLRGEELARYRGDNYDRIIDGVVVENYYYINEIGGRYNLSATERASDGKILYLELYDIKTKKKIDLLDKKSDVDAFFGD